VQTGETQNAGAALPVRLLARMPRVAAIATGGTTPCGISASAAGPIVAGLVDAQPPIAGIFRMMFGAPAISRSNT